MFFLRTEKLFTSQKPQKSQLSARMCLCVQCICVLLLKIFPKALLTTKISYHYPVRTQHWYICMYFCFGLSTLVRQHPVKSQLSVCLCPSVCLSVCLSVCQSLSFLKIGSLVCCFFIVHDDRWS